MELGNWIPCIYFPTATNMSKLGILWYVTECFAWFLVNPSLNQCQQILCTFLTPSHSSPMHYRQLWGSGNTTTPSLAEVFWAPAGLSTRNMCSQTIPDKIISNQLNQHNLFYPRCGPGNQDVLDLADNLWPVAKRWRFGLVEYKRW